ncbi:MAG: HAMP domain-containing histidine kinase [Polyangiaceae bacterium]|nr:HAMP domain-containing histidine kinase [Polyangiaceae bacterium]
MTAADPKLVQRLVLWQLLFSLFTSATAALAAPRLLLLTSAQADPAGERVFAAVALSSIVPAVRTVWVLRRHRFVLRALSLGSRSVEPFEMAALLEEIWGVTFVWAAAPLAALALLVSAWRPTTMDSATTASVAILAAVIVAAASLPLHVVVRRTFVGVIELADPEVMREVVETSERLGPRRSRVAWRLIAAVATPVAFVGLGSALISGAHVRRADERQREETARAVARAALDLGPGVVANAGLEEALAEVGRRGFHARIAPMPGEYSLARLAEGVVELTAPLDAGQARVTFAGSTVPVVSAAAFLVATLVTVLASAAGLLLGRSLARDLRSATVGVSGLSEHSTGPRIDQLARFRVVKDLGKAIERLAARFRVFARAQRRAIRAREAAAQMRGLFFASVSHDLKSPLNAILGFAELLRQNEPMTDDQAESLDQIERSGRELLALIETVLDAARVEAGQLSLVREPVELTDLVSLALDIGRDLGPAAAPTVEVSVAPKTVPVRVDRIRIARVLAAFIGQALRASGPTSVRIMAASRHGGEAELTVALRRPGSRARDLAGLFDPQRPAAALEPRGLALALGVAESVVKLHGGSIRVEAVEQDAARVTVYLPRAHDSS